MTHTHAWSHACPLTFIWREDILRLTYSRQGHQPSPPSATQFEHI